MDPRTAGTQPGDWATSTGSGDCERNVPIGQTAIHSPILTDRLNLSCRNQYHCDQHPQEPKRTPTQRPQGAAKPANMNFDKTGKKGQLITLPFQKICSECIVKLIERLHNFITMVAGCKIDGKNLKTPSHIISLNLKQGTDPEQGPSHVKDLLKQSC